MNDAHAWALHVNGRDAEALVWLARALALGTRNALFHYHAGMIHLALGDRAAARESCLPPSRSTRIFIPWPPRSAERRSIS